MRLSIKQKTTILVAIIIIATMALLWLGCFFLAEPAMLNVQKETIRTLYESIEEHYSDDPERLSRMIKDYEEGNHLRVEIFNAEGVLIYTSGRKVNEGFGPGAPFDKQPPLNQGAAEYRRDPAVQRVRIADREVLVIRGILKTKGGEQRFVSIETPIAAISGIVSVMNLLILGIAGVVVIVGCLIAYFYAKQVSRPIVAVSETAKRAAAMDFSNRADEKNTTTELAELAVSINTMSSRMEAFIGELMEKNRRLAEDNERLEREEEMRRSFVANVSHDLKSPLSVLGGYAEMMKEQTAGIDHAACCDVIIEETARMNEMIASMLEVSALENGLKKLKTAPLELGETVQELLAIEQPLFEKKGQRLLSFIDPEICVSADEEALLRALRNVLENARTHTPENGVVAVTVTREGAEAVLSVYNDGENIPPEKLERIWESFYRTDEARTRDANPNVGLGLYIVRTVIHAHGGRCEAVNERAGVRFNLRLQLLTDRE
ncbi:MAG: HAMP domain-containing protein [Clostridia bacterium]|nr:HAMP domain-containing protein [Clostridia bacterium]